MKYHSNLVKRADAVFSLHIRNRGATFGYNHCFTCGKYLPIDELQAGHFIPRRYHSTRWHPVNVWAQCNTCNVDKHGNLEVYERKLVSMFSQEAVDELWELARSSNGLDDWELKEIIKKYA